jgi:transcriptional regulator with GAF, ATPase, and Fis domain
LKLIADEATKHVDAERATIFILDRTQGELWGKVALGVSDTIRFDARLGIAGAVLIATKPLVVEDAYKSPLFSPSIDSITGYHTKNILSVPLRTPKQDIIGVFQVLNKREGKFTTEDEHFVQALANQAAIALENAQALTELENRQQELIEENESLRKEVEERFTSKSILGTSTKINDIRTIIDRTAETSVSVLITGENGTGKLSARAIHI